MNLESSWRREPGIVARRIAGETLLVPVTQRVQEMGLFTLNEVASFVWERLDGVRPVGELVNDLVDSFQVDEATAQADLATFIGLLERTGCARQVSA